MAIINVELETQNLLPVNGVYTFTTNFYNATTDALLNDIKYPQNQVYTTSTVGSPFFLPLEVADGSYTVSNVKIKIAYKNQVKEYTLPTSQISCTADCTIFPITSVSQTNNTTFAVGLSGSSTQTVNWKIINSIGTVVSDGTSNVTTSSFNITTPILPNGSYLLELLGSTCRGKSNFAFNIANTVSPCTSGPSLWSIINNTSSALQFQFDGVGVFGITWRIKQGSTVVRNGVTKHVSVAQSGEQQYNNSTPVITFAQLSAGSYTFEIEGFTCSSTVTSKPLTISNDVALAFVSGSPSVTGSAGNYSLGLKINKSGAYNTVVLNTTTGNYYQNGNITYTANTDFVINTLPVGQYYIKIGTLESNINIQNTGGSPCTLGPNLTSVISPSQTALNFLFDGQGVTAITWRIKQSGNILRNSIVYPANNTPSITYNELPFGTYTLEIEGNNCTSSVSSANFTIAAAPQGNNAGVLVTNVGNKYIGIINARVAQASVNPSNGAIKLTYNEISTADTGNKQVKCWLLDSQLCEVKASEIAALRSSNGLLLPDGNYHFYLYYAATTEVSTFEQLRPKLYELFLNPATWPTNSKTLEEIIIEVKTNI